MKIGVVSDTHQITKNIDKIIQNLRTCDLIIHAGDNFIDSKYIHSMTNVGVMAVKGNCDFCDVEDEILFEVEGKNIFLCHGDKYDVKYDIINLKEKAKKVNADIVIFGHTHIPFHKEIDDIVFLNPGSLSFPREVSYKSFVIIDICENDINVEFISI